jgi:hypothetical protein
MKKAIKDELPGFDIAILCDRMMCIALQITRMAYKKHAWISVWKKEL